MNRLTARAVNFFGFWVCGGLIAFAYYLQWGMNIQPCPLCILERLIFAILGLIFLTAFIHNPQGKGKKIYGMLALIFALFGMLFAGRHLWLQAQPTAFGQVCVPGFNYLMKTLSPSQAVKAFFLGSSDCAVVNWSFLGLSIPGWTFLFYDVLALIGMGQVKGFFNRGPKADSFDVAQ